MSSHRRPGPPGRRALGGLAVAVVALAALGRVFVGTATAGTGPDPSRPGPHHVAVAEYHLGDTAFRQDGFTAELTGVVHYPTDVATGTHPLVMISHGFFATCADRAAADAMKAAEAALDAQPGPDPAERARLEQVVTDAYAKLQAWPCPAGIAPVPSYRGYDYLGDRLASDGFVVVSISANGLNAGSTTGADDFPVRAALVNRHLAMWQQLAASGTGPLAGAFPGVAFRGHLDLTDVGTIGHSKGGRGAVYQAADAHAAQWPPGVTVRAVVPLEPVLSGGGDDYLITKVPFLTVEGACDSVSNPGSGGYFHAAAGQNHARIHQILVHGANHNFFNTEWSPAGGQVTAVDDANDQAQPPLPAAGQCQTTDPGRANERQLTEDQQRAVGAAYVDAFFRRYLDGDTAFDPMLTGATHPLSDITAVDVTFRNAQS